MSRKADPLQQLAQGIAQHFFQQLTEQSPQTAVFFNMVAERDPDIRSFFNVQVQQEAPVPHQPQQKVYRGLRPGAVIKDAEFTIVPKKR